MIAPISGPMVEPAPPTTTTSTNRIDCMKPKVSGVTNVDNGANKQPARPASMADTAKATVLITNGLRPMDSDAVSLSLTARIAAPQVPRASQQNAASKTAALQIASNA